MDEDILRESFFHGFDFVRRGLAADHLDGEGFASLLEAERRGLALQGSVVGVIADAGDGRNSLDASALAELENVHAYAGDPGFLADRTAACAPRAGLCPCGLARAHGDAEDGANLSWSEQRAGIA